MYNIVHMIESLDISNKWFCRHYAICIIQTSLMQFIIHPSHTYHWKVLHNRHVGGGGCGEKLSWGNMRPEFKYQAALLSAPAGAAADTWTLCAMTGHFSAARALEWYIRLEVSRKIFTIFEKINTRALWGFFIALLSTRRRPFSKYSVSSSRNCVDRSKANMQNCSKTLTPFYH